MNANHYRAEFEVWTPNDNFFWSVRSQKIFGEFQIDNPQEGLIKKLETPVRINLSEAADVVKRFVETAILFVESTKEANPKIGRELYTAKLVISEKEEAPPGTLSFSKRSGVEPYPDIVPTTIYLKGCGEFSVSMTSEYGGPLGDLFFRAVEFHMHSAAPNHPRAIKLLNSPEVIARVFEYFKQFK